MPRRTFEVIDIVEVLQHWRAGRKKAVVASSLGVDRGTVGKYVGPGTVRPSSTYTSNLKNQTFS